MKWGEPRIRWSVEPGLQTGLVARIRTLVAIRNKTLRWNRRGSWLMLRAARRLRRLKGPTIQTNVFESTAEMSGCRRTFSVLMNMSCSSYFSAPLEKNSAFDAG
jgi:hypothetical protein